MYVSTSRPITVSVENSWLLTDCCRLETSQTRKGTQGVHPQVLQRNFHSWCFQDSSTVPSSLRCHPLLYGFLDAVVTYVYNLVPLFPFSVIIFTFSPSKFSSWIKDIFKERDLQKFLMSRNSVKRYTLALAGFDSQLKLARYSGFLLDKLVVA
jgi:hypothetical protein